jgi:uncharacterized damage-inducible protein DinB
MSLGPHGRIPGEPSDRGRGAHDRLLTALANRRDTAPVERPYPEATDDERELLLSWLRFEREAVLSKVVGLNERQARLRPVEGANSILGLVKHLTVAERRWIDGAFLGGPVPPLTPAEFEPEVHLEVDHFIDQYLVACARTDEVVHDSSLRTAAARGPGRTLLWVLIHLIEETARHAGHADITRQWVDGAVGI